MDLVPTRDLSPEEQEVRAQESYEIKERIVASLRAGRIAAWELAEALYEFDERSGWLDLGYEKIADFLADEEVGLRTTTYYAAVARWRKIVVHRQVTADRLEMLDPSKVDIVLPAIERSRVSLNEALDDVEALGARDLREKYIGRRERVETEPPPDYDLEAHNRGAAGNDSSEPVWADDVGLPEPEVIEGRAAVVEQPSDEPVETVEPEVSRADPDSERSESPPDAQDLAKEMARVLWRIAEEVAPPEKKRMRSELRDELTAVLRWAINAGLLDG